MCSSRKTLFSSLVHNRAYVNHRSKQMVKSLSEIREPTHTHTHTQSHLFLALKLHFLLVSVPQEFLMLPGFYKGLK